MKRFFVLVLLSITLLLTNAAAMAHGPVDRVPEEWAAEARLFVADADNGNLVVVDLPDGKPVARLSTPPFIMGIGLTPDDRYLFVTRGRNTDKDYVTVINTAFEPFTGKSRLPFVTRTFEGFSPDGSRDGHMTSIGGSVSLANELKAELLTFDGNFNGLGEVSVQKYALAGNAHYHYAEVDGLIYVGHLQQGLVQVLNKEKGNEVARLTGCPVLHGIALDKESGRLFFGCQNNTLVMGTQGEEKTKIVARIPYPEKQRVAAFLEGKERILWGYTEGTLPLLYRLDVSREPYTYETVPVSPSIRQAISTDQAYLLSLSRSGAFQIRDSASGNLLRSVNISQGWSNDFHEHVDKAVLPDIVTNGNNAYVSLPNEGRIAQVDLKSGKLIRYLEIGGQPTRMVLLAKLETDDPTASSQKAALVANGKDIVLQHGDKIVKLSSSAFIKDSHVWLPLRAAVESFGSLVEWIPGSSGILVSGKPHVVKLAIGDKSAQADGIRKELHGAPIIVEGLAYVNEHDLAEILDIHILPDFMPQ